MDFKTLLKNEFVFLDGGMGTELQKRGMEAGKSSEEMNSEHPEWVIDIMKSYINAGSNIVSANTFSSNRIKLEGTGRTVEQSVKLAFDCAKKAAEGTDALIAIDVGPIGQLLEPTGTLTFEEAYDIFKEVIVAGKNNGADLVVIETMTDIYEVKAALLAAKENTDLPVLCYMTFEKSGRTFTGCSVPAMALVIEGIGADAIGVNCSLGPNDLYGVVEELIAWTDLPVVIKPNAGLPDPATGAYDIDADMFAGYMKKYAEMGVKIFGGCCGTSPDYISALVKALNGMEYAGIEAIVPPAVCSYAVTVDITQPRIIGERINPTGKKLFKEALKNNDIDYILGQAIDQVHAGADILDVNVGLPEINEKEMMVRVIKALQGVVDVPLQIDSTIPEVIEAGLRVYNGKPIVNSVNGEEKSLETILPMVKKYGAAVVGLTLDENGIPKKAEERFAIAERIVKRAAEYGIRREDVYIDCLTLTASAEQAAVMETLKAVKMVKEKLGVRTVLGVSNISFGLPNRELVNHNFLTMALTNGLDLPIINPNVASMTGAVRAYKLLANIDKNSTEYIANYSGDSAAPKAAAVKSDITLEYAIANGLKNDGARITGEMLETVDPMEIINGHLIPALDKTGSEFEAGKIFLPQLILSAGVAQACFDVIKAKLAQDNNTPVSKGKIIVATVKGDIHDIGKNIVKTLLENYGYTVIDLGKDVPEQLVVDTAIKENVKLVGLSALMTTTLKAMEDTIRLLRENNVDCRIMVGGAVLTPDYAEKIGADFYSKDAKESVDIAKKVLG